MSGTGDERDLLVVDGDLGPELARRGVVLRPSAGAFPLPVREPVAVRQALIDVARAGADVLTASTGDLHRRALGRIGAARRSREWVRATLDRAREARDEAGETARTRDGDLPPRPLRVGGLILPLDGVARPDLSPDGATASAEHRAHAGILAECGAEFLRIESMSTIAESEVATVAALETGLETWSGAAVDASGRSLRSGEPLERWAGAVAPLGVKVLTLATPTADAAVTALGLLAGVGPLLAAAVDGPPQDTAERLIAAGATLLSAGADGSPDHVAALRAAVASEARLQARRRHDHRSRLLAWIDTAAERAPGGPALWLGSSAPSAPLPTRFGWDVATLPELRRLPTERYRLAVAAGSGAIGGRGAAMAHGPAGTIEPLTAAEAGRLVASIERGGWLLVGPGVVDRPSLAADDRLDSIEPAPWPGSAGGDPGWLARRRP